MIKKNPNYVTSSHISKLGNERPLYENTKMWKRKQRRALDYSRICSVDRMADLILQGQPFTESYPQFQNNSNQSGSDRLHKIREHNPKTRMERQYPINNQRSGT